MDYIAKYIIKNELNENELVLINHVRLYKKIYLPFKLVRIKGEIKTKEFKEIMRQSNMKFLLPNTTETIKKIY